MKSNKYGNYPPVSDFRWHDLPVYSKRIKSLLLTEDIRKNQSANSHYSMLTTNGGYEVIIGKKSLVNALNLTKNIPEEEVNEILNRTIQEYPDLGHFFELNRNLDYLPRGSPRRALWHIMTLNYSANIAKLEMIVYQEGRPILISSNVMDMDVFIPTILFSGSSLVKKHAYDVLVPENTNTWMEREIDIKEASPFCVDVVYLMKNELNSPESPLNVTLTMQNGQTEHFTHNEASKKADATWQVARFENRQRRFKGKMTIRLSVGSKDLEIGGIKFCTGGDLMVVPTDHGEQYNCQIFSDQPPKTLRENYKKVATNSKICERLGKKDCSELRAGRYCFAGYSGGRCQTPCPDNNFGVNCAEIYPAGRCVNDEFSRKDGSCNVACGNGTFSFPLCINPIRKVDPVVVSVSRTAIKLRMPDSSQLTGHDHIAVQYRKIKGGLFWHTKVHKETDGEFVVLDNLTPNTDYEIAFVVYEHNWELYLQNLVPSEFVAVKTCRPIDGSNLEIQIDDSGAALISAGIDEDYCQMHTLYLFSTTDIEKRRDQFQEKFLLKNKTNYKYKLNSCESGSYYDVMLLDVNENEVDARLNCTSKDHLAVLSPPKNPLVPNRCQPISESLVEITINDPLKVFITSNTSAADRIKVCAPKLMRIALAASRNILITKQVDAFGSEIDFGDCVIGSTYDVTLVDQEENELTVKHACWTAEHRAFRQVFPIIEKVGARKIELDMKQSLNGSVHYKQIQVQFREKEKIGEWKSVTYKKSMGRYFTVNTLKPGTSYLIRFEWSSPNHPSIEGKVKEQQTSPCIAIDYNTVDIKFEAPLTAVANWRPNALEQLEELCHWKRITVTSGKQTVLNIRVFEQTVRWDLSPCEHGREFVFRLQDEQGNSVETSGTCTRHSAPSHENDANSPSTSRRDNLTPMAIFGTLLIVAFI
ncbi:Hypothetical predicted protein [Cloeon dipterum]|nr:Hypothetical predicted protein [Cloeon dipterum]